VRDVYSVRVGRGVFRRCGLAAGFSVAAASLCVAAVAAAPTSSAPAAKPKRKANPQPLSIVTPKQGRVSAMVLTFTRKEGAKPPRVTLAQRYRGPKTVSVAAGIAAWANTPTKWVALVTVVNFKPPPPGTPPAPRALAAAKPPTRLLFRAAKPYTISFKGNVRVDRAVRRSVIQILRWTLAFSRKQTGVALAYANPDLTLHEVRYALAGLPHREFADAVLGRIPADVP
jgi:hypothetical protein